MADTTKITRELKLVAGFVDGDTRIISYPDPKENISAAQIAEFKTSAAKVLEGDRAGADFDDWESAQIVKHTTTYLDIGRN